MRERGSYSGYVIVCVCVCVYVCVCRYPQCAGVAMVQQEMAVRGVNLSITPVPGPQDSILQPHLVKVCVCTVDLWLSEPLWPNSN